MRPLSEDDVIPAIPARADSFIYQYMRWASKQTDAPLAYHLGCALAVLATTAPSDLSMAVAGPRTHANLFVLLVGRSGEDRKCLPADAVVATPEGPRTVAQLERSAWRSLAWTGQGVVEAPAYAPVPAGVQDVHRIRLENGMVSRFGYRHPVLTPRGWVKARDLLQEDSVAVPLRVPDRQEASILDPLLRIVGMLISDGSLTNADFKWTKLSPIKHAHYVAQLHALGLAENHPDRTRRFRVNRTRPIPFIRVSEQSPLIAELLRLGLTRVKSPERFVPDAFMRLSRRQTGLVLGGFWSGDGAAYIIREPSRDKTYMRQKVRIVYTSRSRVLCENVRDLLLFMGLPTTLTERLITYKGTLRPVYETTVVGRESKVRFLQLVKDGVIDAPELALEADALIAVLRSAAHSGGRQPKIDAETGIWWVPVRANMVEGRQECFDIEVPGYHTFVAEGVVTHNSTAGNMASGVLQAGAPGLVAPEPGTEQGFVDQLALQPTQLVYFSEFGGFLAKAQEGTYYEALKTRLNDAADARTIGRVKANGKGVNIENPRVSFIGACATPYLEDYTRPTDWSGGFMGRFLVLYGKRERLYSKGTAPAEDLTAFLHADLYSRSTTATTGPCLGFDDAASRRWDEWFQDVNERNLPDYIVGARARVPTVAAKVALVYGWDFGGARSGQPWYVTRSVLDPAIAVAELHLQSVVALADRLAVSRDMRDRRRVLEAIDGQPGTFGQVIRRAKLLKRRTSEILETLLEEGTVEKNALGGEPLFALTAGARAATGENGEARGGGTSHPSPHDAGGQGARDPARHLGDPLGAGGSPTSDLE